MDATPCRRTSYIAKCTVVRVRTPSGTLPSVPTGPNGLNWVGTGWAYVGVRKPSYLHQMKLTAPIRMAVREALIPSALLATLCCGISVSHAQSTKPSAAVAVPAPSSVANSPKPQMNVDYAAGKLTVTATNASLDQILREVSHSLGMKITGEVADERVFGQYGPSAPSVVLADLLDGTGSNMLLVDGSKGPTELILTPRTGGPTPPSPSASRPEPEEEPAPEAPHPPPAEAPHIVPRRGVGHPSTPGAPPDSNPDDSSNGSDAPQSPNGTKTPQQIYNELRQMQQQQTTQAPQ
jgi:hypothetical protein